MILQREKNVTKPEVTWVIICSLLWPTTRTAATLAPLAHMLMPVLWALCKEKVSVAPTGSKMLP